jgi:iron complex outermembrane recepter protein
MVVILYIYVYNSTPGHMKNLHLYITVITLILSTSGMQGQTLITGTVTEESSAEPLEFTQVALLQPADSSLVAGAVSDTDGSFQISTPPGPYLLRVTFVGYEELWMKVDATDDRVDLGVIHLSRGSEELDEVEITAAARLFRSEVDRRVYNVENMPVAEGGTAIQVLETLPSVQVDEEGNISLRGSGNILIYIDGRPTNLSSDDTESILEQYPASLIKDVELITNPSARYEAEGVGGIININLKESRLQGLNGQVNTSTATGSKYTGGATVNYHNNGIHLFSNYAYQYRELWEENISLRENFTGTASPVLDQNYNTSNYRQSHVLRTGVEFDLGNNQDLRLHSNLNFRSRDRNRRYELRSMNTGGSIDSLLVRDLSEDQYSSGYEFGLNYFRNGNGTDNNLMMQMSYAFGGQDRIEYFDQRLFDPDLNEEPGSRSDQIYERPLDNRLFLFQLDYGMPLSGSMEVEAGLRSTIRNDNREQVFSEFDFENQQYVPNNLITDRFEYNQQIYAGYLIFSSSWNRLGYQAGLRAEQTNTRSYHPGNDESSEKNYFSLFPSFFMNYELGENHDIQANYSRRIRRPGIGSLMPLINAQDLMNLRIGNPNLDPSITDNYELSHIRSWDNYMITSSLFHRTTQNALTRIFILHEDMASMVTWTNAHTNYSTGFELINYFDFSNNVNATLTGNFYNTTITGENNGEPFSNSNYSWSLSLLGNFRIPDLFNVQLMGRYQGPRIIPQGEIEPVYALNIGLRRNILDQQGTISLNFSDIFNTRMFSLETMSPEFYQHRQFNRESRIITLSFTYRFRGFQDRQAASRDNGFDDTDGLF